MVLVNHLIPVSVLFHMSACRSGTNLAGILKSIYRCFNVSRKLVGTRFRAEQERDGRAYCVSGGWFQWYIVEIEYIPLSLLRSLGLSPVSVRFEFYLALVDEKARVFCGRSFFERFLLAVSRYQQELF